MAVEDGDVEELLDTEDDDDEDEEDDDELDDNDFNELFVFEFVPVLLKEYSG